MIFEYLLKMGDNSIAKFGLEITPDSFEIVGRKCKFQLPIVPLERFLHYNLKGVGYNYIIFTVF